MKMTQHGCMIREIAVDSRCGPYDLVGLAGDDQVQGVTMNTYTIENERCHQHNSNIDFKSKIYHPYPKNKCHNARLSKPYFTFTAIKSAMTLVLRRKGIAKIMVIIMVIIIVKVPVIMTIILKITNNNINYFTKTNKSKVHINW